MCQGEKELPLLSGWLGLTWKMTESLSWVYKPLLLGWWVYPILYGSNGSWSTRSHTWRGNLTVRVHQKHQNDSHRLHFGSRSCEGSCEGKKWDGWERFRAFPVWENVLAGTSKVLFSVYKFTCVFPIFVQTKNVWVLPRYLVRTTFCQQKYGEQETWICPSPFSLWNTEWSP